MSDTPESAALNVSGLSFNYGAKPALADVSFVLSAGRFKVLLGPNGAGKTTLFSLITRLFDSPLGEIRVGEDDLRKQTGPALAK
ncbi:MAG TPA: ATP-binding cassette domain-containing protein, partial [Rhodospirillales bacterium]|nr:ATP-binding cassette domain-containing protein [Rhodospirillales bacterium]